MQHSSLPDSGTFAHHVIDRLLPTTVEKADLKDLTDGILELQVSSADTANPPTALLSLTGSSTSNSPPRQETKSR